MFSKRHSICLIALLSLYESFPVFICANNTGSLVNQIWSKDFYYFSFFFLFLSSSSSSGMNDKSPSSGPSVFIISSFFNRITICIDTVWVLQSHFKFFFHISFVVGIVYFFKKTRIRNMSISSLFIIFRCSGMFHLYKSYQKLLV